MLAHAVTRGHRRELVSCANGHPSHAHLRQLRPMSQHGGGQHAAYVSPRPRRAWNSTASVNLVEAVCLSTLMASTGSISVVRPGTLAAMALKRLLRFFSVRVFWLGRTISSTTSSSISTAAACTMTSCWRALLNGANGILLGTRAGLLQLAEASCDVCSMEAAIVD